MLHLVATPIGNLADITFRAIEVLRTAEYVLCEDTRHSGILMKHYSIATPLKSFHKFSESEKEDPVINDLRAGINVALISDAGTPGISDPGSRLVKRCVAEGIPVISIPGPCAAIAALTCSGMDSDRFQFYGFLPRASGELKTALQELLQYSGTTICYESPERIESVLEQIGALDAKRPLAIARELTKKFEEIARGTASELLQHYASHPLKGEIVLLISGAPTKSDWESLTPEEHVAHLEATYKLTRKEAIKMAAEQRGVPKRTIYQKFI